jgi:PAS domain S-box-containing protein
MGDTFDERLRRLRKQAEARLGGTSQSVEGLSLPEVKNLIHEYQVHQIELELQNEELRETQKQLELARDRYARLFNDAPVGYLTIDETGIIAQANETFAAMVGREPSHLSGTSLAELIVPADRRTFHGRYRAFCKHPEGKELDFRLQGPSGNLTVRCVGKVENETPLFSRGEAVRRMLLAVSDVSRQVRAENTLREREQYLNAILETTRDGFWTLDMAGRVTDVNAAYLDMSGYSKNELRQMSIPDLEALEKPEETEARIKRIIAEGSEYFETMHRRKDGSLFDVEVSVSYIESGGGKFVCFCRDITARKRAEALLRHREEEFRAMAENAPDIVARFDQHFRHVYINRAIEKHTGMHREEFIGRTNADLNMPEEHVKLWHGKLGKVFQSGQETEMYFDFLTPAMRKYYHSRIVPEFAPDGTVSSVLAITRDITEQQEVENEIKRINQRLEIASAEKDKLFAIIAHDLKSPMSGLVVSTRMLAEQPEIFSEKDFGFLATELHKNAQNTFALLEDLLQWARMSQGGIDYAPIPTSLNDLLNMGLSTAQDMAKRKEIALRLDIAPGLTVLVDQPMIKTVIRNILFNAIKFTPRQGEIRITARQSDRKVTISIQDNGMGMNGQMLSSIFAVETGKRQLGTDGEKGTGLGLVLCKQFIEQHSGKIWLESGPGQGTKVYFTLPMA